MAQRRPFSPSLTAELASIVEGEIESCRALLHATEAVEAALEPLNLDALDAAVAARAREFRTLEALEHEATGLRGEDFEPPEGLSDGLALLRNFTRLVQEADARAREATKRAMDTMRGKLRAVNAGQQGLKGYRGSPLQMPRFADKKG